MEVTDSAKSEEEEEGEAEEEEGGGGDGSCEVDPEEQARRLLFPEPPSSGEDSDWIISDTGEGWGEEGEEGEGGEEVRDAD